jgi:hypothetical protein
VFAIGNAENIIPDIVSEISYSFPNKGNIDWIIEYPHD